MSAKYTGLCWELDLPHDEMLVLQAMADHADHEGRNVRPSQRLVAWKAGYDERSVRRIIAKMEKRGILVPTLVRAGRTTEYRIDLDAAPRKERFSAVPGRPRVEQTPGHDDRGFAEKTEDSLPGGLEKPRTSVQKTPDIRDINGDPHLINRTVNRTVNKEGECARSARTAPARFVPPSLDEVQAFMGTVSVTPTSSLTHDAQTVACYAADFMDYYGSNGWKVGRNPMKDWQLAARRWLRTQRQFSKAWGGRGAAAPDVRTLVQDVYERAMTEGGWE